MEANHLMSERALSVREFSARYAIGVRKTRDWIRRGLLRAIDVGGCRRQFRIPPEAVAEFENRLAVRKPAPRRQARIYISPTAAAMLEDA